MWPGNPLHTVVVACGHMATVADEPRRLTLCDLFSATYLRTTAFCASL